MTSRARLDLRLLGGFQAQVNALTLALPTRKTQALLAYLAMPSGQVHSREQLATLLWGDMQNAQARGNLRHALSRIGAVLPKPASAVLVCDSTSVSLDPTHVDVDVTRFGRLAQDTSAAALQEAVKLYRGELLAGLMLAERSFDDWLATERHRLRGLAIEGAGRLLALQQKAGGAEEALQTALHLLSLDPIQEPVHRTVMRLYAQLGRRDAARLQYQRCVDALKRELDASPDGETTKLYQEIQRARPVTPGVSLAADTAAERISLTGRRTNLPAPTSELIGRGDSLKAVKHLLGAHRLVTLIGAGGVGKTRLSLEVGRALLPEFADGVWVVELAPLSSPDLVPVTVAVALGLTPAARAETAERVAAALAEKRLLLVLDNCEHVIEATAWIAEALLRANPHVRVMATSREPLRAPGEFVYGVPSLEVPTEGADDQVSLLNVAAVRLFVARAQAADRGFSLDARTGPSVGAICRRLDGIPLAIELAAARAATLGVEPLAARLHDRFRLLSGGHRTALPRHQTLRATLDWSYDLLPSVERIVFQRLGIFAGTFALAAAAVVVSGGDVDAFKVEDSVADLAGKSLVIVEAADTIRRFRLLETTRAYALERLGDSGELDRIAQRHAAYFRDLFERAEGEWDTRPASEWLSVYGRQIDNVRAALDWAFAPGGDPLIGVTLTAATVPLWFRQSHMVECRDRFQRALNAIGAGDDAGTRREMRIRDALGMALMQTLGAAPDTIAAWTTTLEMAERLGETEYQLRALWGLWLFRVSRGECRAALALAQAFCDRVTDPVDGLVGERMVGTSLHYMGDQTDARRRLEGMLCRYVDPAQRSHASRFQYDQPLVARLILARILWLQGLPDQAIRTARESVERARALDHALSLCGALEIEAVIAIWSGDFAAAEPAIAMLLEHSTRHGITGWHARGRCWRGVMLTRRGDFDLGFAQLRDGLDDLRASGFVPNETAFLGTFALGQAGIGQVSEGLVTIDSALGRCERDGDRWCIADLLRIKAELLLVAGGLDAAPEAERHFQQALEWARQQEILSIELRCATGLASLWKRQEQGRAARALLAPVYARFTEGFTTADVRAAKALLGQLRR